VSLVKDKDMKAARGWTFCQLSSFNSVDSLLLVSGWTENPGLDDPAWPGTFAVAAILTVPGKIMVLFRKRHRKRADN